MGSEPETTQVPRGSVLARGRLAVASQIGLEPARLETAGGIPRDLISRITTPRPDEESWDFDGNEQDFGEEKNHYKKKAM
jgi:hypothetical protein